MVEDDDEQFQRLLKLCCFLTIACISLFFYIIYSLRRIIRSALVEYKSREFPKPPIEYFVPLTSPGAITGIFHNTSTNCVDLALSVHPEVTMFVLRNTPLMAFHNAMLAMSNDFFHFLQSSATEEIESVPQNLSLKLTSQEICPSEYRHAYDLVIAFTDKSALVRDAEDERVAISFYMIHVKQHEGSSRPTGILYAYCKTNQDRLICVRVSPFHTNLAWTYLITEMYISSALLLSILEIVHKW